MLFSFLFLLSSCDKEKTYDVSKAVSFYSSSADLLKVDKSLDRIPIKIPHQQRNSFWIGSASSQNQIIENFEKNFSHSKVGFLNERTEISFRKSWHEWLFYSGNFADSFVYSPIITDKKIYVLGPSGLLLAYDLQSKKKIWQTQVFKKSLLKNYKTARIGYRKGKIFAVSGINSIVALDEIDGRILWSKDVSAILASTPVSDGDLVFAVSDSNKIYAFDIASGDLRWSQSSVSRPTAIFGSSDPILYENFLLTSFSSGEVCAINKKSGEIEWSQDLNLSKATNSDFYLNDIDATPVVKDEVVYVIGNGGLMKAISFKSGNYLWKKEIAGVVDFWVAGEFVFLINNDNKLLAIHKKSGGIKWIVDLPDFENVKKPITKFIYSGLVMAGDMLVITREDGKILVASPLSGKVEKTFSINKRISHSPIIVDNKIFIHAIGRFTEDLLEIL